MRKDNCLATISEIPTKVKDGKWIEMDENVVTNLAIADGVLSSIVEKKTTKEI